MSDRTLQEAMQNMLERKIRLIMETIYAIRHDPDYIATAVQYGKLDPKLRAIKISNADNHAALVDCNPALQGEVEELNAQFSQMIFIIELDGMVGVAKPVLSMLHDAGIDVVFDIEYDPETAKLVAFGVFDATPDVKFAF